MNYIDIADLKNAWVFRHNSLPIADEDIAQIKPMSPARANVLWDTFISRQVDHPDFFKNGDWPQEKGTWKDNADWEKRWDSDEQELPALALEHLDWDDNTTVYFCCSRNYVIETRWAVFKRCWKNFLFMDDGSILVGKKRQQAVQFMSNGRFQVGQRKI